MGIKLKWFRARINLGSVDEESDSFEPQFAVYRPNENNEFSSSYRQFDEVKSETIEWKPPTNKPTSLASLKESRSHKDNNIVPPTININWKADGPSTSEQKNNIKVSDSDKKDDIIIKSNNDKNRKLKKEKVKKEKDEEVVKSKKKEKVKNNKKSVAVKEDKLTKEEEKKLKKEKEKQDKKLKKVKKEEDKKLKKDKNNLTKKENNKEEKSDTIAITTKVVNKTETEIKKDVKPQTKVTNPLAVAGNNYEPSEFSNWDMVAAHRQNLPNKPLTSATNNDWKKVKSADNQTLEPPSFLFMPSKTSPRANKPTQRRIVETISDGSDSDEFNA